MASCHELLVNKNGNNQRTVVDIISLLCQKCVTVFCDSSVLKYMVWQVYDYIKKIILLLDSFGADWTDHH